MRSHAKRKAATGLDTNGPIYRSDYGTDGETPRSRILAAFQPRPTIPIRHYTALPYDPTAALNTFESFASFVGNFSYSYKPNSDLLEKTTYLGGTVTVYRAWDILDRLTNITSVASVTSVVNSFSYELDSLGRRVQRTDMDNSQTQWKYDGVDQLTNAVRSGSPNGAADAAYNFGYKYDLVGNRLHEDRGQLDLDCAANNLNQLQRVTWSGKLDVVGSVGSTGVIVKVAGTNAVMYNATNYLGGAVLIVGSNTIPIVAWLGTNATETNITVHMPLSNPEVFSWDANGNMTSDGSRIFTWNDENRLVAIESGTGIPACAKQRTAFVYDGMGRMVHRSDYSSWSGTAYAATNRTRHIRNGYRVLAEISGSATNYHVWGLDLSQSLDGAGGIGGLLSVVRGQSSDVWLYTYCGNGNVQDVLDSSGAVVAHYDYSPFGRIVSQSGVYSSSNLWRFSAKLYDFVWSLIHYEYRPYSADLHIFLSRDPIAETGMQPWDRKEGTTRYPKHVLGLRSSAARGPGVSMLGPIGRYHPNTFTFSANRPTGEIDLLGLVTEGENCCENPCKISQFRIKAAYAGFGNFNVWANWNTDGKCENLALAWWDCTFQQFANWQANANIYAQTAVPWFQISQSWSYPYGAPVIFHAKIDVFSCEAGQWKLLHVPAENSYTCDSGLQCTGSTPPNLIFSEQDYANPSSVGMPSPPPNFPW